MRLIGTGRAFTIFLLLTCLMPHPVLGEPGEAPKDVAPPSAHPSEEEQTAIKTRAADRSLQRKPWNPCTKLFIKYGAVAGLIGGYFLIKNTPKAEDRPWIEAMKADTNKEYILVLDQWKDAGFTIDESRKYLDEVKKLGNTDENVAKLLGNADYLEFAGEIPRKEAVRLSIKSLSMGEDKTLDQLADEWKTANKKN